MLLSVVSRFLYTAVYFFIVSVVCVVVLAVAIYKVYGSTKF